MPAFLCPELRRASATWSALTGQPGISLMPGDLLQPLIDRHLARAGVSVLALPNSTISIP
jgi:hypothetical protein